MPVSRSSRAFPWSTRRHQSNGYVEKTCELRGKLAPISCSVVAISMRALRLATVLLLVAAAPVVAGDLVSELHSSMRGADTVLLQFKPLSAWGTMRHAMRLPIPWTIRAPVEVPQNAELVFDIAVVDRFLGENVAAKAEPTRFRLTYTPDGGTPAVLLDRLVDPKQRPRDRGWIPRRIDLGRFAGTHGVLELRVEVAGHPEQHGVTAALVSRPALVDREAYRRRPNLLLVTIDALRADHLGCYGYHRPTSPALDRLAGEGVRFANAFANAPMTVPSLPQLFTGRYFPQPGVPTLLSSLYAGGIRDTLAIVRNPYLQVFLTLDARDSFDRQVLVDSWRAPHISRAALEWIDRRRGRPFALYLHYLDTHTPYTIPEPAAMRFADPSHRGTVGGRLDDIEPAKEGRLAAADRQRVVDLYDGTIRWVDDHLGRVLEGLRERGLLDKTLVVVTADHGEELFERGSFFHGQSLYDELLHVPLLVRFPGGAHAGRVVEPQVGLVDLLPSIAEIFDLPVFPGVDGVSWMPLVRGEPSPVRAIFARAANPERPWRFAVRLPTHKLIYTVDPPAQQLFDLVTDPEERVNLVDDPAQAGALAKLRALLDLFRAPLADFGYQVRAVPRSGGEPVELEVRVRGSDRAPLANPDRIGRLGPDRLELGQDGQLLSWRTRLGGTPQGIRFDWARLPDVSEATLTVEASVDGRRIEPGMLRLAGDGTPASALPLQIRAAAPRPFAVKVEAPSLAADAPPTLAPPTSEPVLLYVWRAGEAGTGGVAPPAIDEAQRRRLKALGYAE
jgi:arylsulfatase A-like enzyme